ncbi:MAG: glycosyltransferase family 2 protein [Pseudomonadota bacterium]
MAKDAYTVVSTMKNEAPYILDWVAHYKVLGFDHIVVCTNDCTDPTVDILKRLEELGYVTHHPTVVRRAGIHRSALRQASRLYDEVKEAAWVFVCDVDEYLNIHVGDGSARALVEASGSDADVIAVPWRCFGAADVDQIADTPVTEQFGLGELPYDPVHRPLTGKFVKSLYTNKEKFQRMGLHGPVAFEKHEPGITRVLPGGALYTVGGKRTEHAPLWDVAQVNHYAVRSLESFLIKRARGRANHSHHTLGVEYWEKFNLNDLPDSTIAQYRDRTRKLSAEFRADKVLGPLHEKAVDWHLRKAASIKMDPEIDPLVEALSHSGTQVVAAE